MEGFAVIGFVFGIAALAKVVMLENKLKEKGILEQENKSD
jgi:hypothetical protein|tara:strand:- start:5 stop:124 length:120 start_codon:yes stop_codon:yes gene_type:complete